MFYINTLRGGINLRKIISITALLIVILSAAGVNAKELEKYDVIVNGETFTGIREDYLGCEWLPLRDVAKKLGYSVTYDGGTKTAVKMTKNSTGWILTEAM